jgi:hypothetical protein
MSMIIAIERDVLKRQQTADSTIQEQFKKLMNEKLTSRQNLQFGILHMEMMKTRYVIHAQWNLKELYQMFS